MAGLPELWLPISVLSCPFLVSFCMATRPLIPSSAHSAPPLCQSTSFQVGLWEHFLLAPAAFPRFRLGLLSLVGWVCAQA